MNKIQNTSLKPEYVLKRVNDLINNAVGGNADKEKALALDQLHAIIGVKRKGIWTKSYEALMKRHVELCVDLKDHLTAKDGLHQYRNLCQNVDPNSLEIVIVYLMDLSESRARAARQKADKVALTAAARVADLDQAESPVSIMLSSMTEEGSKDRTDREVVVPWLKFLWENYRSVLELLYRIPKLEKLYHQCCVKAFKFCQEYSRNMEFRRLCEMLRQHLASLTNKKVQVQPAKNPRPLWEWTPEALDAHLQIRFSQLEVATNLELWNEGFRTIEDIFGIMVAGKFRPKPKLMVMYYEKLTRIFWVSDNKLFHAYAWFKFYSLSCESKRDLKAEDRSVLASSVLLSALAIPAFKDIYMSSLMSGESSDLDDEVVVTDKQNHIAQLLDFQHNPSRKSLLADIISKNIMAEVIPELAVLYECLEVKFQPLTLVKSLAAAITAIKSNAQLSMYALPLQRVIVTKVMQQLSRAYSTVRLSFVYKLLAGLQDMSEHAIEKVIIEGAAQKQLQLRINHAAGSIQFTSASSADTTLETQASQLGTALRQSTISIARHIGKDALKEQKAADRREYFMRVLDALDEEYSQCMDRKIQIERRKERVELLQQDRERERARRLQQEETLRQQREADRAAREEREREEERNRIKMEKMEILRIQRVLESYGVSTSEEKLAELDSSARQNMIVEAQADALKAKEEEARRLAEQTKKLDHITRALRIEGASAVARKYAAQMEADRVAHEENIAASQVSFREKHANDKLEKERMVKMQSFRSGFEASMVQKQRLQYDAEMNRIRQRLIKDRRDQNVARAHSLRLDELERQEEEVARAEQQRAREEQQRIDLENAERLRKQRVEEEEREKEREKQREAQRAKDEEDKRKREKFMAEMAEKEARKKAEEAAAAATPATGAAVPGGAEPEVEKKNVYQPPSARGGASGGSAYRPPGARGASGNAPAPTNSRAEMLVRDSAPRSDGRGGGWGRSGGGNDRGAPEPVRRGGGWGGDRDGGRDNRDSGRDGGRDSRRPMGGGDRDRDRRPAENSRAGGGW